MIRQRFFSLIGFRVTSGSPRKKQTVAGDTRRRPGASTPPAGSRSGQADVEARLDGLEQVLQHRHENAHREVTSSTGREHPLQRIVPSPLARVGGPAERHAALAKDAVVGRRDRPPYLVATEGGRRMSWSLYSGAARA